jgi:acyl carrier protein
MTKKDYFLLLDELLENDPGTIRGDEVLTDIPKWDSLAIIGFIALLDQHFVVSVPAVKIINCRTVDDLAGLVGDKLTG